MLGDANAKQEPVSTKLCSPRVTGPSLWGHGRPERSSEVHTDSDEPEEI